MHESQQRILDLAANNNLATMSLRDIGEKTGIGTNPQLVRHHLHQLVKNGFLTIDKASRQMTLASTQKNNRANLIAIPIMGQANCGPATSYANDQIEGYIQVSPSLIKKSVKKPYALKAVGESMTDAKIPTFGAQLAGIDDGDYVIVDGEARIATNNEYVVAVIDGLANIKKLKQDEYGVRLVSESRQPYPPITIDPNEQENFVNGKVLAVVKA
jgi:SOS-response transcriptional repressor LexA